MDRPKVKCVVSGEEMDLTPEEEVRQLLALRLLGLGYRRDDLRSEFTARFGSQPKRLDIAVFRRSVQGPGRYLQQGVLMIAECKRRDITPRMFEDARAQLESYLSACPNATFGIVTNGDRTTVIQKSYQRGRDGLSGVWQFVEVPSIPRPDEVERLPGSFEAPTSPPARGAFASVRLVAKIAPDGAVTLPEGRYRVGQEYLAANPAQCIRLEGGVCYWCYEGELYTAASDGMSPTEIAVRVAHVAETERARRRAVEESKANELAALAAEAERLRRERAAAYARSPEGVAAMEAERARVEAGEARRRAAEAAEARRQVDEQRQNLERRQRETERLEQDREAEQRARWAKAAQQRMADEAHRDVAEPGWREERARRRRENAAREGRALFVAIGLGGTVPGIVTAVALTQFGWLGALVASVALVVATLIIDTLWEQWDWGAFAFISLPCMVAAVLLVKVGVWVGLGLLLVYGVIGYASMLG